jgi:mannose-1-phosphate guanylyltransferase
MKAFLLSAGLGTRMKPLTNDKPKCLLPVCGEPLLYIWMDLLEREGVEEVLINTHLFPEKVEKAVNDRMNKIKIKLFYEKELLGSGGTILANRKFVESEEDFYILYSDNLTNVSLKEILDFHRSLDSVFTTYVYETNVPEQKGIFLADETGKVLDFEEKPLKPKSNIANAGLGVLNKRIFNYFCYEKFLDFGKNVMPEIIGKMYIKKSNYYIKDIGTLTDYYASNEEWGKIKSNLM